MRRDIILLLLPFASLKLDHHNPQKERDYSFFLSYKIEMPKMILTYLETKPKRYPIAESRACHWNSQLDKAKKNI